MRAAVIEAEAVGLLGEPGPAGPPPNQDTNTLGIPLTSIQKIIYSNNSYFIRSERSVHIHTDMARM